MGKRDRRIFFTLRTVICAIVFICLAIDPNPALSDCNDIRRYTSRGIRDLISVTRPPAGRRGKFFGTWCLAIGIQFEEEGQWDDQYFH